MKILIPMAGAGSRFSEAGYQKPKPIIDVKGHPMISSVTNNLKFDAEYIFIVRQEHLKKFPLERILKSLVNNCKIIVVDKLTAGAACTALLAKEYINNDDELLIANSDQVIEYSLENFNSLRNYSCVDGIVFTFFGRGKKWSFVKQDDAGKIIQVAEKNPISNIATCGIYYYRKGSDFVNYAEQMIQRDIRTNNEFYIAPVYNNLIDDGKILVPFFVEKMWGLGTPEDLKNYLKFNK